MEVANSDHTANGPEWAGELGIPRASALSVLRDGSMVQEADEGDRSQHVS